MTILIPVKSIDNKPTAEFVEIWLERKLNDWSWQLTKTKHVVLINRKTSDTFTLDKVRLMSFMKFAISALDKMRIEEGKTIRKRIKKAKEKTREAKMKIKEVKKSNKQQSFFAKAKKVSL